MSNSDKMCTLITSNQLEARNRADNCFASFPTRSLPENFGAMLILGATLLMVLTVSMVIQRLKRFRHADRSALVGQKLSIKKNFDVSRVRRCESKMINEQILDDLHSAADKCFIEKYANRCVELINYCPELSNVKLGSTGLTPFHRVCFHGHAPLIRFMLSKGANPNLTSNARETAIGLAVYYYLNKRGGDDGKGMPCLDILHRAGCRLEGNGVWYDMLLKKAVQARKTALVEWLFMNKQMPKSNRLERSVSHPLEF